MPLAGRSLLLFLMLGAGLYSPPAPGQPAPSGPPAKAPSPGEAYNLEVAPAGRVLWGRARLNLSPADEKTAPAQILATLEGEMLNFSKPVYQGSGRLWIDRQTLLPVRGEYQGPSPMPHEDTMRVEATREGNRFALKTSVGDDLRIRMTLPEEPRDPVSAFLAVRSLPLKDGEVMDLYLVAGGLYRVAIQVGRAQIETPAGKQRAIRLEGYLTPVSRWGKPLRHSRITGTAWLSDDDYRSLLRVDVDLGVFIRGLSGETSYTPTLRPPDQPCQRHASLPGIRVYTQQDLRPDKR